MSVRARFFASLSFSAALSLWRRVPSACVGDGERGRERGRRKRRRKQRIRAYLQKPSSSGGLSSRSSVKSAELAETCAQELRNVTQSAHTHTRNMLAFSFFTSDKGSLIFLKA